MKSVFYIVFILTMFFQACGQETYDKENNILDTLSTHRTESKSNFEIINSQGQVVKTRFLPPKGYKRIKLDTNSFANYLRNLPLKPHNTLVKYYDGSIKFNYNYYDAVVDLEIGNRDLHQCADAIMRLRAEYLWNRKEYDKIHFNFTNGFRVNYNEWMKGKRIAVKGNSSYWIKSKAPSNTYNDFWKYMEIIFSYAGTLSLSKELVLVDLKDIKVGDIFIQGGSPGHAVIVVDIVINKKTNKKLFLLAQSFMPAQEIQILKNPNNSNISPWYSTEINSEIFTPEWSFDIGNLKRFED